MPVERDPERKARERAFHDRRFTSETRDRAAKYYAVDAAGARYREILAAVPPGATVLECGCGIGSMAFELARRGVRVIAIDLSPVAVGQVRARATEEGLHIDARVMDAEALSLPSGTLDVVIGSGILHHLDLRSAFGEVARVLRPTGWAVFVEPLGHNPAITAYRRLTPSMRTPDEHPLRRGDLALAQERFGDVQLEAFDLLALAGVPIRRYRAGQAAIARLHGADRWLFARYPRSRYLAWVAVLALRRPRPASA
ncbi:MAG: class I SAM-dependent methyltransferase [Acidimicrobiales bacterium]|nr:class I SAM-dependent methyltransferase [Acidimicrobiales bacterium]